MTTKDLRINYHRDINDSPFTTLFQIYIDDYNHRDVITYIEYLENKLLEIQDKIKNFEKND